jgi:hypothetical protein
VGWHADASNDNMELFNYIHTGLMLVNKSTMTGNAPKLLDDKLFIGDSLFLTAVAYMGNGT